LYIYIYLFFDVLDFIFGIEGERDLFVFLPSWWYCLVSSRR